MIGSLQGCQQHKRRTIQPFLQHTITHTLHLITKTPSNQNVHHPSSPKTRPLVRISLHLRRLLRPQTHHKSPSTPQPADGRPNPRPRLRRRNPNIPNRLLHHPNRKHKRHRRLLLLHLNRNSKIPKPELHFRNPRRHHLLSCSYQGFSSREI